MMSIFKKFEKETVYVKHWKIKDSYIYNENTDHWLLKKFIVIYKDILVNREPITKETLIKINQNFDKFINSIENDKKREAAIEYFSFDINDLPKFSKFNTNPEQDDLARKFFALTLMKKGGQSGINKKIKEWISDKKSLNQIQSKTEKWIKKNPSHRSSLKTTINDYPAFLRNQSAVFTYYGFFPSKEEGYVLTQMGELVYDSKDEIVLNAIVNHQKLKLRVGNPILPGFVTYSDSNVSKLIQDFNHLNHFKDYNVNPFLTLLKVLNNLKIKLGDQGCFIDIDEYMHIISRMAPFDIDYCTKLIIDWREQNFSEEQKLSFNKKVQKRKFRRSKLIGSTEDFYKELKNQTYGFHFKSKFNKNHFLDYKKNKLIVTNHTIFDLFISYMDYIESYMIKQYGLLYNNISNDYSLKQISEVVEKAMQIENFDEKSLKKLKKIHKHFDLAESESSDNVLSSWEFYFQSLDVKLFSMVLALDFCVQNFSENPDMKYLIKKFSKHTPKLIYSNLEISKINSQMITSFFKKEDNFLSNIIDYNFDDIDNGNIDNISSNSTIKEITRRDSQRDFIVKGHSLIPQRNQKLMEEIRKKRSQGDIHYNVLNKDACDLCEEIPGHTLECHHIIPIELGGPDHQLNYVFICKNCHNTFTHETHENERYENIKKMKLKKIISNNNFKVLIKERQIQKKHLDVLINGRYIHYVQYLELKKYLYKVQKNSVKKMKRRIGPSGNRWSRAMTAVFERRIKSNVIMNKKRHNFPVLFCDGGCNTNLIEKGSECHHMIPKMQRFHRHGNKPLNGPESDFNYIFLCKDCHQSFTSDSKEKDVCIKHFRKLGLVSKETVFEMILTDGLTQEQLMFLFKDDYINKEEYKELNKFLTNSQLTLEKSKEIN